MDTIASEEKGIGYVTADYVLGNPHKNRRIRKSRKNDQNH